MPVHRKKRFYEAGRQPSMTKLGVKRVRPVRSRGGNLKWRALRIDAGNFTWGSEQSTRKTKIVDVVYNATNNELVRTKTVTKNTIVQIDATPFRQWYNTHYAVDLGKKKKEEVKDAAAVVEEPKKKSRHVEAHLKLKQTGRVIDNNLADQFISGKLFAVITSRPGQSGRADGVVLEGHELEFYLKKMEKKKRG